MCKAVVDIKEEGIYETLASLVKDGLLDINEAAKRAKLNVDDFKKVMKKLESK